MELHNHPEIQPILILHQHAKRFNIPYQEICDITKGFIPEYITEQNPQYPLITLYTERKKEKRNILFYYRGEVTLLSLSESACSGRLRCFA
jgi:hypothetical protein